MIKYILILLMVSAFCLRADDVPNTNSLAHGTNSPSIVASPTNLVHTSKAREAIMARLNSIRVPKIEYDQLPLAKALYNLAGVTKSLDPEKTGVRFFINREGMVTPARPGLAAASPSAPSVTNADASNVRITLKTPLLDVRLAEVLDAITNKAAAPIKYSITDYGVVFSLQTQGQPLEYRAFHVDPAAFGRLTENHLHKQCAIYD